jgi:hypothetical protein
MSINQIDVAALASLTEDYDDTSREALRQLKTLRARFLLQ